MIKIGLFLLAIFASLSMQVGANELQEDSKLIVEAYLQTRVSELEASEYKKARSFMLGDLNDDTRDDLAILYTLEGIDGGGNDYSFFLAAFLQTDEGLKFSSDILVGGKRSRSLSFKSMRNGVITFDTRFSTIREDGTWDPSCCPSGEGKAYYVLINDELAELNTAQAQPLDWKRVLKAVRKKRESTGFSD